MATYLSGLVATPVTPFSEDGGLDLPQLQRLVDFLVVHGADGMALPMHIGENLKMTSAERKQVAEAAVEAIAGRVPIFVNTSGPGTDEVVELSRHAQSVGADGVVVITPYHWRPSPDGLVDHFVTVAGSVDIGMIAYNYPLRLGVTVTPDVLMRTMAAAPNLVGLKDASLDMEYFTEMCRVSSERDPDFAVFSGVEYMLPAMAAGAKGSFSACGGVAPRLVRALYERCLAGDNAGARPLQFKVSRLFQALFVGYPATIKVAMGVMGRPVGPSRRPVDPISDEQREALVGELKDIGIVGDEPEGW
jgi:4-hydroxy-tetrahydrodipicolinate synthase